jgi:predicted nucleotidyltransferase
MMEREKNTYNYSPAEEGHIATPEVLHVPSEVTIIPPFGASFFLSSTEDSFYPDIVKHPKFIEQVGQRKYLYGVFTHIFDAINDPCITMQQAVKDKSVTEEEVVSLWEGLTSFFKDDENNPRLLLYLPFEMLPDIHHTEDLEQLEPSAARLAETCRDAWLRLLHESEPRANYTDGDILESGIGEPERISKAGHLTPEFLARGIIDIQDVRMLLEIIPDEFFTSLSEGTVVAHDRGIIKESDWQEIQIIMNKRAKKSDVKKEDTSFMFDPDSPRISKERADWLRKTNEEKKDEQEAEELSVSIVSGRNGEEKTSYASEKVRTLSIFKVGEKFAQTDLLQAKGYSADNETLLLDLFQSNDSNVTNAISGGLNKWLRLGLIDAAYLQRFGIEITDLSEVMPYSTAKISKDFEYLTHAAEIIRQHPVLSQSIYPAFLLFGSRIKGYADLHSDVDAAIVMRPEADFSQREKILNTLQDDIPEFPDRMLEFWTTRESGQLQFMMPKEDTRIFIGEKQVHFLMNGAWIVSGDEFSKIQNEILERYVDLSRFGDKKEEVRSQLLGQIELDLLQYRIMHKGYRKYYPQIPRSSTENSDLIDWESDFWDPGYRRIATQLFLSRVFLPDLSDN